MKVVLVLCLVSLGFSNCLDVEKYLQQYGYYNPNSYDQSNIVNSIKQFQRTFNLPITGVVDESTKKLMNSPRCGVSDHNINRNAFRDVSWSKKYLTYYFHSFSPDLSRYEITRIVDKAFKFWSDVTPLVFTRTFLDNADIVIGFGSGQHSDNKRRCSYPFDGESGTLAHAYFPPDGRMHFDEDETWTDGVATGQNLLAVAVHELGHILGLEHDSSTKESIMYPYAPQYDPNMKLHANDIRRIQSLYGTAGGTLPIHTTPSSCRDRYGSCDGFISYCNKSSWLNHMMDLCKKTCKFC